MDMKIESTKGQYDHITQRGCRGANGAIALLVPAKVIEEKMQEIYENVEKQLIGIISCKMMIVLLYRHISKSTEGLVQYYILATKFVFGSRSCTGIWKLHW
ncbi:MAG: hypothetical protein ACLTW9_18285 [Enterocloster sp.]